MVPSTSRKRDAEASRAMAPTPGAWAKLSAWVSGVSGVTKRSCGEQNALRPWGLCLKNLSSLNIPAFATTIIKFAVAAYGKRIASGMSTRV